MRDRGIWLLVGYTMAQALFHAATDWETLWWLLLVLNGLLFMLIARELDGNPE